MSEVVFHFNVADKTDYALRLLRSIHRKGARALVMGPSSHLDVVDRMLWCLPPEDFVPHVRGRGTALDADTAQLTPLLMFDEHAAVDPGLVRSHPVFVHLGEDWPAQIEAGWQRCVEIVSTDEQDRQRARQRWRRYEALGWPIARHEVPV